MADVTKTVALSPVEQALVIEVAAWVDRATAEIKASADQRLAVILDAHGLLGATCQFTRTDAGWVLVPPPAADGPAVERELRLEA